MFRLKLKNTWKFAHEEVDWFLKNIPKCYSAFAMEFDSFLSLSSARSEINSKKSNSVFVRCKLYVDLFFWKGFKYVMLFLFRKRC